MRTDWFFSSARNKLKTPVERWLPCNTSALIPELAATTCILIATRLAHSHHPNHWLHYDPLHTQSITAASKRTQSSPTYTVSTPIKIGGTTASPGMQYLHTIFRHKTEQKIPKSWVPLGNASRIPARIRETSTRHATQKQHLFQHNVHPGVRRNAMPSVLRKQPFKHRPYLTQFHSNAI